MVPAVFLDRDGVIIQNMPHYVRSWEDVSFIENSLSALNRLAQSAYKIVIVTNQSAIGRGILPVTEADEINQKILAIIMNAGGRVDGLYVCPHTPEAGCNCRKPKPGLILQAVQELSIDLNRSVMIGDALSDVQAGQAAGIPTNILLMTGRGRQQHQLPLAGTLPPFQTFHNLESAIHHLLSNQN